jgi:peptide/nickel transport system ATP-binding protein
MELVSGRISIDGQDIAAASPAELRALRGARVSMAFQEPMSAFDPLMTVGDQIMEALTAHERAAGGTVRARMLEALRLAGIPDPQRVAAAYAFELSGGLRQRTMIAQAVVCRPGLLIADEPTSSLDVTTQDKILELFLELRRSLGLAIVLVTHDLGVVRRIADDVVILYEGAVVERGRCDQVMNAPQSAYAKLLIAAEG